MKQVRTHQRWTHQRWTVQGWTVQGWTLQGWTLQAGRAVGVALTVAGCLLAAGCTSGSDVAAPSASAPATSPAPSTTSPTSSPTDSSTSGSSASPATPPSPGGSTSPGGPTSPGGSADVLSIAITISGGKVDPSGQKINARVGQQVELVVNSDIDDEIHAHIGGDGYELGVPAGKTTTGRFTLDSAGSFEVESHHLEKVIVIVNAR